MESPDRNPASPAVMRKLLLFGLAGALGAPAHYLTLILLVETGTAGPVCATIAGSAAGALVNYMLNRRYTFRSARPHWDAGQKFATVAACTGILNALLVYLGADLLGVHYLLVQVIATLVVFLANFALNSAWTFREEKSA